jgi:hypothetical protein
MNSLIAGQLDRIPRGSLAQNMHRAAYEQVPPNAPGCHLAGNE